MTESNSATLLGHPTCAEPQYFCLIGGRFVVSTDIREVLCAKYKSGGAIELNPAAISHLLHDGFVPQPQTVYKDVFVISIGMSATAKDNELAFEFEFPFSNEKSRQDSPADPAILLNELAAATEKACSHRSNALLMLSAGLDSSSLALAAKAAGRDDVLCVTYAENDDFEEATLARALCARLGLRHQTYWLDFTSDEVRRMLLDYAAMTPQPCGDPALTACVAPISHYSNGDTVVLDGSGNDAYFWKPPRSLDLAKLHLGVNRMPMLTHLRGMIPMHLRYERLLSSPLELLLFAGPRLRHCDTRAFYPESVDTQRFWLRELGHLHSPAEEVRSTIRSAYLGPGAHMLKTRNAVMPTGASAKFPWAERSVASYCFHLPEQHRFDRKAKKGKIIIREMLRNLVDYDEEQIGKRVFKFNKRRLLEHHIGFCREQILSCSLWRSSIGPILDKLTKRFFAGRKTENALLGLLMVSLWHNHWVRTELPSLLRREMPDGVAA